MRYSVLLLFCFFIGTIFSQNSDLTSDGYTLYYEIFSDYYIYWKPPYDGLLEMALTMQVTGYLAIGFTDGSYSMVGSEAVIGWASGSNSSVNAYYLGGKSTSDITTDSILEISSASAEEVDGVTTVYFTRTYDTGRYPIKNNIANIIVSFHYDTDAITEHSKKSSEVISLDLVTGTATAGESGLVIRSAHGFLMFFSLSFLLFIGAFVARFARHLERWITIHMSIQISAIVIATIAFILALKMCSGAHFHTTYHGQLGTFVIIICFLQIFVALFRPQDPAHGEAKTNARKIFGFLHSWVGRLILVLSIVLNFSGIDELEEQSYLETSTERTLYILYGIYLVLAVFLLLALEIRLIFVQNIKYERTEEPEYTLLNEYELND